MIRFRTLQGSQLPHSLADIEVLQRSTVARYLPACRAAIERNAMTDIVDSRRRSEMMAGSKGQNAGSELVGRRIARKLGLRSRLHRRDRPGRSTLVFPRHRLAVFVHGRLSCRYDGYEPPEPGRCRDRHASPASGEQRADQGRCGVSFQGGSSRAEAVRCATLRQRGLGRAYDWQPGSGRRWPEQRGVTG